MIEILDSRELTPDEKKRYELQQEIKQKQQELDELNNKCNEVDSKKQRQQDVESLTPEEEQKITEAIKKEFAVHDEKYDVKKLNKITIESVNYVKDFEPESNVKLTLQDAFQRTMMGLIFDKIKKRCLSEKKYSTELDFNEKIYLLDLFKTMYEVTECSDSKITERVDELEDQLKKQLEQEWDNTLEGVKS